MYSKTENLSVAARAAAHDYLIVEVGKEAAEAAAAGCELVEVIEGRPASRWREWVGAVKKGPAGVKALVGELERGSWREWFVTTRPALVLLHCGEQAAVEWDDSVKEFMKADP